MGKYNYIQTNVTAGELSPKLYGRTDLAKYNNGCATLENFFVKYFGGAFSRPGSYFVNAVKDSTTAVRLIPFQYSTEQAYIIEVGNLYMRFYKDNGRIESGGSPVEVVSPYLASDIFELQFTQSADVMYIVHKNYPVYKLSRTSHTAWTLTAVDFRWGPFLPDNTVATTTITPSATTGSITLTASAAIFVAGHIGAFWRIQTGYVKITAFTDTTHITATVIETLLGTGATDDWAEGAWSSYRGYPSSVCFFEQRLFFAASTYEPQTLWGSESEDYEGFEAGATAADALVYTIATEQVNTIQWLSSGKNLSVGTAGGTFNVSSGSVNEALTPTNVNIKKETSYGSAKLATKRINNYLYYIQKNLRTVREYVYNYYVDSYVASDVTLLSEHVTESGIVDLDYQETPDNAIWCVRADGEMAVLVRQTEQEVAAWLRITTDGDYKSVAIIPNGEEDQVWTVVERTIGGVPLKYIEYFKPRELPDSQEECFYVDSGLSLNSPLTITGATKANPCVVTSILHGLSNGNRIKIRDVVGMTEINNKHFKVKNVTPDTFELTDLNDVNINSSAYTAYASGGTARKEVNSVSGLSHLEGKTISLLVDGATHPTRTVSGGAVTLNNYYSIVHAGLKYTPKLFTLKLEQAVPGGSAQNLIKRIPEVTVRLYRSLGCKIGNASTQDEIFFRTSDMPMDAPPTLFSGDKTVYFPVGYNRDAQVYITQDYPLPVNVLLIISQIEINS